MWINSRTTPPYDSAQLTVFMIDSNYNSEVNVYRDSATGASVMNTDSNFAYFVSRNRQISCFNFSDQSVSNCISDTNDIRLGKVIHDGGFKYLINGSRIIKEDMSSQIIWISDSLFNMYGMMIHNGMVYACGTDGYKSCTTQDCWGDYDPIIAKWNANGALIWKKNYEKSNVDDIDKLFAIAIDEAGDIVTIGITGPWDQGAKYIYSIVVDTNGVLASEKIFSNNSTSISSMNYLEDVKLVSLKNRTASLTFRGQIDGMSSFYAELSY